MTNCPVGQTNDFRSIEGECLFSKDFSHVECSYVRLPSAEAGSLRSVGVLVLGGRWVRMVVRGGLTGSASTGSKMGSRVAMRARAAVVLIAIATLGTGCGAAEAATQPSVKAKPTAKRKTPTRPTTTVKRPITTAIATTTRASTTLSPKLSAEAQAVLAGYESYLVVFAAAAHEPEHAQQILPKGVTGDALARLIELARFNVSEGQYWDGSRADIISKPRVQSIGESRSTIRDCRSVGGMLRTRTTNAVVPGSTDPDVDDLIVDLVKLDGRWVVTRTDRTNSVEGKGTCAPASSP